jgi:hypothetical protein
MIGGLFGIEFGIPKSRMFLLSKTAGRPIERIRSANGLLKGSYSNVAKGMFLR